MKTKFIEATSNFNWGKFMVARFTDEEWAQKSAHPDSPGPLLRQLGWGRNQTVVFDLQACEGAMFCPPGAPVHDLEKHKIWVCPMFPCFLEWLYKQDLTDLDALPSIITIPQEIAQRYEAFRGYRRPGPPEKKTRRKSKT